MVKLDYRLHTNTTILASFNLPSLRWNKNYNYYDDDDDDHKDDDDEVDNFYDDNDDDGKFYGRK